MKKIFLTLLTCLFSVAVFSQSGYTPLSILNYQKVDSKWFHFGFTLGINYMDFAIYNRADNSVRADQVIFNPGFSVGIVTNLRLNENWDLRFLPGLEFGERVISYNNLPESVFYENKEVTTESVFVNFPLLLKYRAKRLNNFRPYIIGGVSYKIDVHSEKRLNPDKRRFVLLNSSDVYLELGAGIDFYLPYFKMSTEIKLALGLNDILNHKHDINNPGYEGYTDAIRKMNSNIVTLVLHFE